MSEPRNSAATLPLLGLPGPSASPRSGLPVASGRHPAGRDRLFFGLALRGQGKAPELLAAQFLGYGFWFGFLYLLLKLKYDRPFWESLGWVRFGERFWRRVGSGVAAGAGGWRSPELAADAGSGHAHEAPLERPDLLAAGGAGGRDRWGRFARNSSFAGSCCRCWCARWARGRGIVLSALPFALLHGPQYAWSWRHVLLIVVAGVGVRVDAPADRLHGGRGRDARGYNATFFAAFVLQGKDLPATW